MFIFLWQSAIQNAFYLSILDDLKLSNVK